MAPAAQPDVTQLIARSRLGDGAAAAELLPIVYRELRDLASRYLDRERPDHTLEPTALVHEAFLRLVDVKQVDWQDRTHFFRSAAQIMRRVLVDHARARHTAKRGADWHKMTLSENVALSPRREVNVLALDDVLTRLAALNERHARLVELRFFAGLTIAEAADAIGVSTTTVEDDWAVARAWLRRELRE